MQKSNIRWVGMDVHKETIAVCWVDDQRRDEEELEIPNEPRRVAKLVSKLARDAGELRICYEAGPCGYALRRQLAKLGFGCEVVAPSLIPKRAGDKVKTDRRDARKLARLFRAGELTFINVPDEQQEAARDLVRCREDLVEDTTRARHRLSKLLLRHGLVFREGKAWTAKHWRWLAQQRLPEANGQRALEEYVAQLEFRLQRLQMLDQELLEVADKGPWQETVARFCCLRGIDTLSALTLVVELGDLRRFESPRQLMSYVGLTPSLYASGGTERRGAITKCGNSHARRVLGEAAHHYRHPPGLGQRVKQRLQGQPAQVVTVAMKANDRLCKRFRKLDQRGKRKTITVIAVARELTGFIWAMAKAV